MSKVPYHVAIIMDGNGRWAKERGLERWQGHRKGIENVRRILKTCKELGIKVLTLFCFSTENWNRPKREVDFLMRRFEHFLDREYKELMRNNIRLKVIGQRYRLPSKLQRKIEEVEEKTSSNKEFTLVLAISYGARQEIIEACRKVCKDFKEGKISEEEITMENFSKYLYTSDLPDPDLLIRTSGEIRISNFLLWQISYTELYFTKVYWPDFSPQHLKEAVEEFSKRERRFGKVS